MTHRQRSSRLPFIAAATSTIVIAGALLAAIPNTATAVEAPSPTVSTAPTTAPVETAAPQPSSEPTPPTPAPPTPAPSAEPSPAPLSVTYAGDSLTAMPGSWMLQLSDPTIATVGGTAINGATTPRILAQTTARDADVLVIMTGTNDLRYGYSSAKVIGDIDKIAQKVGARHVLIAAIAPSNVTKYGKKHIDRRKQGEILNRDLQNHALTKGWMFVDPWAADRQLNGGWQRNRTIDGVHPTIAMAKKVSVRMQQAIHLAAEGAKP